eukprot:3441144-Pyramimonas_sp.AAC.1
MSRHALAAKKQCTSQRIVALEERTLRIVTFGARQQYHSLAEGTSYGASEKQRVFFDVCWFEVLLTKPRRFLWRCLRWHEGCEQPNVLGHSDTVVKVSSRTYRQPVIEEFTATSSRAG